MIVLHRFCRVDSCTQQRGIFVVSRDVDIYRNVFQWLELWHIFDLPYLEEIKHKADPARKFSEKQ